MSTIDTGRLRIAVVTETYPPEINGVANTMRQLVLGLQRLGHQVTLIRPRQNAERLNPAPPRPEVVLVPGLPLPGYRGLRFGLPVQGRLQRLWQRIKPHALYVATEGPLGRAALNAAHAQAIPVLTGFHTQFHQYSRHYGLGLLMQPIVESLRRFHNRSDGTLVPTRALQRELTARGFDKLHVFSRGVDTALFSPAHRSRTLRRAWGCGEDDIVALYVGRIAAEKNIALAMETFDALVCANEAVRCVLVGDGPELARLRRLRPEYIFAGAKVGTELARYYASGDCFVFPSLTETFGNVVTEAMASGLAVIAFDEAAAHEHVRSGVNGITVASDDPQDFILAAVAAASDRDRLQRLGKAARGTAESLSWDHVIRGVEQRLLEVIRHRGGAGDEHETMAATSQ